MNNYSYVIIARMNPIFAAQKGYLCPSACL